jgi:hypothetical protein
VLLVLPRNLGKIKKNLPKLPDLFIQEYAINTCQGHINLSVMHTCLRHFNDLQSIRVYSCLWHFNLSVMHACLSSLFISNNSLSRKSNWDVYISFVCLSLCDKVCRWLATGWSRRWFSPGPPVSSTNKTDRHDITEILMKVALNTIKPTNRPQNHGHEAPIICSKWVDIITQ